MSAPSPKPTWHLELCLLGVGGAFDADVDVPNTNALLEVKEGGRVVHRTLIDCGHTCGRQLGKIALTYGDIDEAVITHAHGDHIDGLEVLGYKDKFLFQKTVPVVSKPEVLDRIWASLEPKMGRLQLAAGKSVDATFETYYHRVEAGPGFHPIAGGRFGVEFVPVTHVADTPSYGLRIDLGTDRGGPLIRWSGDSVFDPKGPLFQDLDAARGDLIFHDCLFYPYYEATVHTHFDSLASLPETVRSRIVLIHHGKIEEKPARHEGMVLGQPFDRFPFQPR